MDTTIAEKPKPKIGRPSLYSDELAEIICERLTTRDEDGLVYSVRKLCATFDDLPEEWTIYNWLRTRPGFSQKYEQALIVRAEMMNDDCLNIVDCATVAEAQLARLRFDARRWALGRMNPKKYGDKVIVGGDAENPVQHAGTIEMVIVDPKA